VTLTTEACTTKQAEISGIVEEVLPNALFRVRLDGGQVISAGISNLARHAIVRLIAGHRVAVEVSSRDPHRGQIVRKL